MSQPPTHESQRLWLGAILAGVLLFVGAVVLPLRDSIARDRHMLANRQRDLEQVRTLASQLATAPASAAGAETPVQVVDRCIASLNLAESVSNRRPFGTQGQGVEVTLDDLTSTQTSQLLAALEESSQRPTQLELHDAKGQGHWSLRLVVGSSNEGS